VIAMTNRELLRHAYKYSDIVTIITDWTVYEDCCITAIDDETVEFTAVHPMKGHEYDFAFQYSSIKTVENITNNEGAQQ
jgi:hypothetical protein